MRTPPSSSTISSCASARSRPCAASPSPSQPGESFGLLGPNGAGKTTTIRVLTTLLRPTAGRAQVAGHDVVRDGLAVRRLIGYIPQAISIDGALTARENLEFYGRVTGVPRAGAPRADRARRRRR